MPDSKLKIFLDVINYIFLIYNIIYTPLALGFPYSDLRLTYFSQKIERLILRHIPLLIFFFYSLLTLNTAYYFKGSIVTNRKKITKNYFETEFKLDFFIISGLLVSYLTG